MPKNVVFSTHVCMHNAIYIFPQRQILFLFESADSNSGLGSVVLWLSKRGVINNFFIFHDIICHNIICLDIIGNDVNVNVICHDVITEVGSWKPLCRGQSPFMRPWTRAISQTLLGDGPDGSLHGWPLDQWQCYSTPSLVTWTFVLTLNQFANNQNHSLRQHIELVNKFLVDGGYLDEPILVSSFGPKWTNF